MDNKKVLATVGGRQVLQQDLDLLLSGLDPQHAAQFNTEEGKQQLLDDLIAQELFYLDAVKNGLDKNEAFVREAQKMHDNFLKQFAVHNLLRDIKVTEDELLNFYNENKHMFTEPEMIKTSHILVDEEEEAKKILEEINAGLSFGEAAEKYSRCPSKDEGGDLGFFAKGRMVPEFEEAAFHMEMDQVSAPIKTQFGYHIIKLTGRKEESVQDFDAVKDQLNRQLLIMKQQETYANRAADLKKEYEVIIKE